MQQQYLAMAITAAATFGLVCTDSWAVDLYVNDEYVEEDLEADPPIPAEQDTLAGDCANADYETIAEALEAAATGDTIILCNCDEEEGGDPLLTTYFPDDGETATILIPVEIESITIKSAFGPARCIVSGTNAAGAQYPVVRLDFAEQELILGGGEAEPDKGFVITGGAAPAEDIYPPYDPTGDSNVSRGGGIRVMGKDAIVEVWDCTITGNGSFEDGGGAYCHYDSTLKMNNCTITGNSANNRGGGIYCDPGGTVELRGCQVEGNAVNVMGGGIFAPEGSIVGLEGTTLCSNTSELHSKNIWGTFEDLAEIPPSNNIAVDCGTATEFDNNPNFWTVNAGQSIQTAINQAGPNDTIEVSPGTYFESLDMEGKTISLTARNTAPGATIIDASLMFLTPCIKFTSGETDATLISGFTLQNGTGTPVYADALNPFLFGVGGGVLCYRSDPTIDACLIRNNIASDGGGVYSGGQSEPSLTGTTYLCNNSPNNLSGYVLWDDACESPTCDDDDGDSIPDSCQGVPTTHEVDVDAGPTAITDAIALANSGDTISLAAGTYLETINPMGKAIQFVGAGPTLTILDGMGANRVIACQAGETDGTTFSDLTVTGGYSTEGGGVRLSGSSPIFTNVEFTDNRSTDSGGGIYMSNGARPVFTDCKFDGNIADWMGGAIHAMAGCRPVFTNTTFNNNQTGLTGGAVCLITAPSGTPPSYPAVYPHGLIGNRPVFTDCVFTNNRALRYGGGVYAGFASPAEFDNCTFENNAGEWGGGGIYVQSVYDYADLNDGPPPQEVLENYYPEVHNGTVFRCCEPQAISGDAQAWYDPWWGGELAEEENCLVCSPDVNKDLYIDYFDLIRVVDAWGNCEDSVEDDPNSPPLPVLCDEDTNGNYIVDIQDLISVLQNWRRTCPIE